MEPPARTQQPQQKSKTYVIPYLPVPHRVGLSIAGTAVILAVSSLIGLVLWKFMLLPETIVQWCIVLGAISMASIAIFLLLEKRLSKNVSIMLREDGITFPFMFKPDLLFRPTRDWCDIAHVLVGSMILREPKGAYEFELEKSKDNRKIFVYFKSGGHAYIDLKRMSKKGAELLFVALESHCINFSRSPQLRVDGDDDDNRRFIPQHPNELEREAPKSFTELWEQEMQDHFSATNFVPLRKGKLLRNGRLHILMQIAAGGQSAIYLAETPEKDLRVVKEANLPPTLDDKSREKAKELFAREATILQGLSHPKIAKVLDYFVEDGRDYLILEFVPGHTLRQLVRQNGPMPEEEVLTYALQIAEILEFLHEQSPAIIHRDITPDNLVLREDGQIVVIDFGAANQVLGTATGTLIGKQAYIAPEQFRGRAVVQSDLYGLGGSMYFMLTGSDPEALSTSNPRAINPDISPGVGDLVAQCTDIDVIHRVANAKTLYEKIECIMENGGGVAVTTSGAGREPTA
ncbi:MAG: serine/threonine-protein kinase [Candidatus Melainabacteria bacterium]|nr:serine/threonine-protein kinase [Candidatus Melainabacteria bacterium]